MKYFYCLLLFIGLHTGLMAENTDINFGVGYRFDQCSFKIVNSEAANNLLKRTKWNLHSVQSKLSLEHASSTHFYFCADTAYAQVLSGRLSNVHFNGINHDQNFIQSNPACNEGELYNFSIGFGPYYELCNKTLGLAILIGLADEEQNLRLPQIVTTPGIPLDVLSFSSVKNQFHSRWIGPWVGLRGAYCPTPCWQINGEFRYHRAFYNASGRWSATQRFLDLFSNDLAGHIHSQGTANGFILKLGCLYSLYECLSLGLNVDCGFWLRNHGEDKTTVRLDLYTPGGLLFGSSTASHFQNYRVEWLNYTLSGQVTYYF